MSSSSQDCVMSLPNGTLIEEVLCHPMASAWESTNHNPYVLNKVNEDSDEYDTVEKLFGETARGRSIIKLERVENPYLLGQYLLKKEKMGRMSSNAKEMSLFHGTEEENVDAICRLNFDWRKRGSSTGHKFGQGVSFTPEVSYASHYGDSVMFLVKVLVAEKIIGDKDTVIPPEPYDTTKNAASTVVVKYEDDDFYPQYVIHYGY